MKIQKNMPSKKLRYILLALLCLLVVGVAVYYFLLQPKNTTQSTTTSSNRDISDVDYAPPTNEQANPTTDPPPATSDNTPANEPLGVAITAANQNSGTLQVRTLITPLVAEGVCRLVLSKSGSPTIEKVANIQSLPSSATCQGFDIAIGTLSPGVWQLSVEVTSGERQGISKKEVTVE